MYFSANELAFINQPLWEDCVEVTDELHNQILAEIAQGRELSADENGMPITLAREPEPPATINERFLQRMKDLNLDYEHAVASLRDTYPMSEATTWPVQLAEAKLYRAWEDGGSVGDPPLTPFLTDLTSARSALGVGDGLADLVMRIFNNDAIYSPAIALLTAKRHAAEKAMTVAKYYNDLEALEAVTWLLNFDLLQQPTATQPEEI